MHLVSQVIFTYHIDDSNTGIGEIISFATIDELKSAMKNAQKLYNMPYSLKVERSVQITDLSAPKHHGLQPVTVGHEEINFIVADKLIYPKDVRKMLTQKYGNTIDFNFNNQWDEKEPVYFSGVTERTQYGLRDSKTGAPTRYTLRSVNCRALNGQDIVINSNLKQIWPIKTDKIPNALTELLKKTKEEIYQR